jgi:hypothetical protein
MMLGLLYLIIFKVRMLKKTLFCIVCPVSSDRKVIKTSIEAMLVSCSTVQYSQMYNRTTGPSKVWTKTL